MGILNEGTLANQKRPTSRHGETWPTQNRKTDFEKKRGTNKPVNHDSISFTDHVDLFLDYALFF